MMWAFGALFGSWCVLAWRVWDLRRELGRARNEGELFAVIAAIFWLRGQRAGIDMGPKPPPELLARAERMDITPSWERRP